MMQKLIQSHLRHFYSYRFLYPTLTFSFKNNLASLHSYSNTFPKNANCLFSNYKRNFKFNHEPVKNRTKILYALTVTGLLKFLGLTEEDEDSELMQILKRGELSYNVKRFVVFYRS